MLSHNPTGHTGARIVRGPSSVNILAIDQGTSATKALVVAPGGQVLGEGSASVHPHAGPGGAVSQDPEELLQSVLQAGRRALEDAGEPVEAVGLGNQGETVLAWDRDSGKALGPAVSWQDRRAVSVTQRLAQQGERLREISGLPLDPYFAAPKMTLLRESGAPGTITTIDVWTLQRLTGKFATDAATASRTMLLDLREVGWSEEACGAFGIDPSELPPVVDCARLVGETNAFGDSPLPVTALAVDQQAALFAQSCFQRGEAKCTYGTGAFLLATAGADAPRSISNLAACVAWRLDGKTTYCLDGQVYTAGAAVGWLKRLGIIDSPEDLDRLGGGETEATFVPGLAGLGAPFWAPEARGGWLDLGLATTREDLVGAVVLGLAAQVAWLARAAEADLGTSIDVLRVDGGLTRSRALMQAQANLLQATVEVYPSHDATALGIAALARLGAGAAANPQDAVGEWHPRARYEPRIAPGEAEVRLARWRAAAEALAQRAKR